MDELKTFYTLLTRGVMVQITQGFGARHSFRGHGTFRCVYVYRDKKATVNFKEKCIYLLGYKNLTLWSQQASLQK